MSNLRYAVSVSLVASLALLVGAAAGCGGSDQVGDGGGGSGGAAGSDGGALDGGAAGINGVAGAGRDGGPDAGRGCAADLTGTWDLVASMSGTIPGAGVLVLGANVSSLAITSTSQPGFVGNELEYTAGAPKMATWQVGSNPPRVIMVQNTPASLDTGSWPIAMGGAWSFTTADERCTVNVAADLVQGTCLGRPDDDNAVSGLDWPAALPRAINGRVYAASHLSQASSNFGALGGEWIAQRTPGTIDSGTCDVTLEGGTFTGRCNVEHLSRLATLTVNEDCVASGSTLAGVELSARRR